MTIPISYSEATNFRLQHALFTQLEKNTQNAQWIRIPAFLAAGNRYLVYLITRICSIAELSIHSLALFLSSEPNSGNRIRAKTMIRHIPTHFGELLVILPALLFDVRCVISDPKAYIGLRVSIVRITINHLEEGTLHTEKYFRDCNEAAGRFK